MRSGAGRYPAFARPAEQRPRELDNAGGSGSYQNLSPRQSEPTWRGRSARPTDAAIVASKSARSELALSANARRASIEAGIDEALNAGAWTDRIGFAVCERTTIAAGTVVGEGTAVGVSTALDGPRPADSVTDRGADVATTTPRRPVAVARLGRAELRRPTIVARRARHRPAAERRIVGRHNDIVFRLRPGATRADTREPAERDHPRQTFSEFCHDTSPSQRSFERIGTPQE